MEPKRLFFKFNNALKRQLDLGAFRFTLDKDPGAFRFYKAQTMLYWYHAMSEFFEQLVESGELMRCPNLHDGRHGVIKNCDCGGSGYIVNPAPKADFLEQDGGFKMPPTQRGKGK